MRANTRSKRYHRAQIVGAFAAKDDIGITLCVPPVGATHQHAETYIWSGPEYRIPRGEEYIE
jgi:hypothetical protein